MHYSKINAPEVVHWNAKVPSDAEKKYTTRIRNEDIFKKNYVCFYVLVQFSFHFNSNLFRSALLPEIKNKTQKSVFVITQIKEKKLGKFVCHNKIKNKTQKSLCVITKIQDKNQKDASD